MSPSKSKHEDPTAVWVKNTETGTVFQAGLAQVDELGDGWVTIVGPDDHTEVGVKTKVKEAVKAQEEAQEEGEAE